MANRNDAVVEILKLGLEFENSIARPGDRSDPGSWFLEHIYIPSLLDDVLLPEILEDKWDAVFLTGNPGDGKSAFLGRLVDHQTDSGRTLAIKHDATEPSDPTDRAAIAVEELKTFLAPLSDEGKADPSVVFVVGINKGMLQNAIFDSASGFQNLAAELREETSEPRALLVDLNERTFADLPMTSGEGLFDRVLERLVSQSLWEDRACGTCEDREWCPFFSNAKLLRREIPAVRLRLLWALQELRGERHATMRDLLAILAYVMVGHQDMFVSAAEAEARNIHPCQFVERESALREPLGLARRLFYNSAFRDDDIYEGAVDLLDGGIPSTSQTFGFAPSAWADLARNDPSRGLWSGDWDKLETKVITRYEGYLERLERSDIPLESVLARRIRNGLTAINDQLLNLEPSDTAYSETLEEFRRVLFVLVGLAKRREFFIEQHLDLDSLTQYRHLTRFIRCIQYLRGEDPDAVDLLDDTARSVLPVGIMQSDGVVIEQEYPDRAYVRWATSPATVTALLAWPLDPTLDLKPKASTYVEGRASVLIYRPLGENSHAKLELRLDEFELMSRLADGFREGYGHLPRTNHLRNFKERLRAERTGRMAIRDRFDPERRLEIEANDRVIFR